MLHEADYSKGHLYILTIPDNFSDLYNLPAEVLNKVREVMCKQLNVQMEGPSQISLYVYDNNTCVVESFLDKETEVKLVTSRQFHQITDLGSRETLHGGLRTPGLSYIEKNLQEKYIFPLVIKPHSFRVFRLE